MEGAVLAGKLAAMVIAERAVGSEVGDNFSLKEIHSSIKSMDYPPREPSGVFGVGAIAFGGGDVSYVNHL